MEVNELKEIRRLLSTLVKTLYFIMATLVAFFMLEELKIYIYASSDFDKYISIEGSTIYDVYDLGDDIEYTHKFDRTVNLREAYETDVVIEFICDEWGNKKTIIDTWLLDEDWNPWIVTDWVVIRDIDVKPWDECYTNFLFTVDPHWYPKTELVKSNDYIIQ